MPANNNLKEVASVFFKLGIVAFGGPAAHIAMMRDEVVQKRKWMTEEHFLDLMGVTNLIPGPNSTEMTMHCGHERAGWKGLFIAGICFIFPAVLITCIFAWLYAEYGQLPNAQKYIYGIKPAVIVIIAMAAYKLGRKAIKDISLAILGTIALIFYFLGLSEIMTLILTGLLGALIYYLKQPKNHLNSLVPILVLNAHIVQPIGNLKIFLSFLKIGAILYGSGYVLFAFLDTELVSTGLLSRQVLLDAVAVGQITPGPVLSTASFIGWQMNGLGGALFATIGMFLPSFLFVWLLNPLIPMLSKSKLVRVILNAINVAAVALIAGVCLSMAQDTLADWRSVVIAVLSICCMFIFKKVNNVLLVIGSALFGYILQLI